MSAFDYVGKSNLFSSGLVNGQGSVGEGFGTGLGNLITGDVDYARQLESLGFQNAFNASEAEKDRSFNALEAQKSRDWSERMSSSAYSRAAADLKSIGINPYAMMSGFSAASSPSGSSASGYAARSGSGVSSTSNGLFSLITNAFALANTLLRGKFDIDVQDMKDTQALSVARIKAAYRR